MTTLQGTTKEAKTEKKPKGRWLCCAIGDVGDEIYWKEPYEVLEEVRALFCLLEEFGSEKANVAEQVADLSVFEDLKDCSFPPLYDVSDFDWVACMRTDQRLGWREDRWPGMSGPEVRIYIWSRARKEVLSQARILRARLDSHYEECTREKEEAAKAAGAQKNRPKKKKTPTL